MAVADLEVALELPTRTMPITTIHSVEVDLGDLRELLMGQGDLGMLLQLPLPLVEAVVVLEAAAATTIQIQTNPLARRQLRRHLADPVIHLRLETRIQVGE